MTEPPIAPNPARPNVLFIMTDQWRWDWLSCLGTDGPRTPHIDALAERGVHMTHLATDSAVCVPARIALASALSPLRLDCLTNSSVLPAGTETWHRRFRDSGYRVGLVGRTDLDKPTRTTAWFAPGTTNSSGTATTLPRYTTSRMTLVSAIICVTPLSSSTCSIC